MDKLISYQHEARPLDRLPAAPPLGQATITNDVCHAGASDVLQPNCFYLLLHKCIFLFRTLEGGCADLDAKEKTGGKQGKLSSGFRSRINRIACEI